jgi:hypothetical protein
VRISTDVFLVAIHHNSLSAYWEERPNLSRRAQEILKHVWLYGPRTDREIMSDLGYIEPNCVRPRVTELIRDGLLCESGERVCEVTGKTVRVVDVVKKKLRQEVLF